MDSCGLLHMVFFVSLFLRLRSLVLVMILITLTALTPPRTYTHSLLLETYIFFCRLI